MQTAKKLGFKKGDFVLTECGFPAILISDVHTSTPVAEVWGLEHEGGSVYADKLVLLAYWQFKAHCQQWGHTLLTPFSDVSKKAIRDALTKTEVSS